MDIATLRTLLLAQPGAYEDRPFGPETLVLKVAGKLFAIVDEHATPLTVSLKCDPAHAQFLRSSFAAVRPGYNLNKEHWNTVELDGSIPAEGIRAMVAESYRLVVAGLSKATRRQLAAAE